MSRALAQIGVAAMLLGLSACGGDEAPVVLTPPQPPVPLEVQHIRRAVNPTRASAAEATALAEQPLVEYQRLDGISGNLSSTGSDTLANLMTLWTEAFRREYPSVNIQVQAAGSSTAPPALTEGTADFGPMSRAMKDKEIESFEARHGYKPTAIRVAIDALAVYVHKDNPLNELSVAQVDAVFSVNRRCGGAADLTVWGDLQLPGSWANRSIQLYGRNSVSGTYGYFKQAALCSGDFKNSVNEQPGSASVVQAVASSLNGIGYSGIGYITAGVKTLAVSVDGGGPVMANATTARDGSYPLARFLYVYVNKRPGTPLPPLQREFLRLVLSRAGQEIVGKDGYIPISASTAARELRKLD